MAEEGVFMKYTLAPSLLAADFSELGEELSKAERAGVRFVHFDVMDGSFVPNISFGAPIIRSLRKRSQSFFDVHMMVEEPIRYLEDMKNAGADRVTIHSEAARHLDRSLNRIRELGMQAGLALNPATPLSSVLLSKGLDSLLDLVLIMSVNPGFGGQKLIPYTLDKIRELAAIRRESGGAYQIGIDGGVTMENLPSILDAGADFLVVGSSIFRPKERISENTGGFLEELSRR